jgi:hypothetical protein
MMVLKIKKTKTKYFNKFLKITIQHNITDTSNNFGNNVNSITSCKVGLPLFVSTTTGYLPRH